MQKNIGNAQSGQYGIPRPDADGMTGWIREWLAGQVCEEDLNTYWRAGPFEGMWSGLDRYWQQQEAA